MKLSEWMAREGLDDKAVADRLSARGVTIDRTSVSRVRRGKQWSSLAVLKAIHAVTRGEVGQSPEDWAEDAA